MITRAEDECHNDLPSGARTKGTGGTGTTTKVHSEIRKRGGASERLTEWRKDNRYQRDGNEDNIAEWEQHDNINTREVNNDNSAE